MKSHARIGVIREDQCGRLSARADNIEFQIDQGSRTGQIRRLESRDDKVPRIRSIRRDRHRAAQRSRYIERR